MKKKSFKDLVNKKNVLRGLLAIGAGMSLFGKSKRTKFIGVTLSTASGGILLYDRYKAEEKIVEEEIKKTEELYETSGLKPNLVGDLDLLPEETEEDNEIIFGVRLLREVHRNCVLPEEMLEFDPNDVLGTLHILQNTSKNRIIVSIPLPRESRRELSPKDIRAYFKELYTNFVREHGLDMNVYLNQVCVLVGTDPGEKEGEKYIYYQEIEREPDETFPEYLERTTTIREGWASGKKEFLSEYKICGNDTYGYLETIRFDMYLNLEFPVFPRSSKKVGLDLITFSKLLRELVGTALIKVSNTGKEKPFELNHVLFHPTDDYGEYLGFNENDEIETYSI